MFPDRFWDSQIWKEAARAGLRQISRMVGQGNLSGASQLAKTPGVLKPSLAGSQIQHLGRGGEGLATMVAHPEHGVAVRKLYDPRGISGPEMIARKEQAGRAIGDNPNFARFLGSAETPHGGQMHFNEYIQPGQAPTGQAGAQSIKHTQVQAQRGLTQAGFAGGKDIREGNMIYDANAGQHRVIDYLPAQKGEFMRMPQDKANRLALNSESSNPLNADYNPQSSASDGGMLGRLLGGRSQPGGLRGNPMGVAKTEALPSVPDMTRAGGPRALAQGTPPPTKSIQPVKSTNTSMMPTALAPPKIQTPAPSFQPTAAIRKPSPITPS